MRSETVFQSAYPGMEELNIACFWSSLPIKGIGTAIIDKASIFENEQQAE